MTAKAFLGTQLDVAILVTQMQSDASYQKAIGQGLFVETLQRYSGDPRSIREVVKTRAEMAELQLALQRRLDEYILTTSMSARSLSTARSGTAQLEFSFDANILECIAEDNIHSLPDWVIPECELHRVETLKDLSSSRCIWKNSSVFVKELHEDIDPSSDRGDEAH
ncbi:hypothetical protein I302_102738 [Kwoniella bestiolae CBS 10118]|uniref:Uncharacterized protein n=1 Tax=Kwoniella bestiolae CBS 10118 TaxID=1296100 RepID=A0A1B9GFY6_9TREE|nr:hypothetical protein I302_01431 [Kwoniella bestiolae CBS 10118]OCF29918.1 hypothetical protein I302_01431 [Kwoniella bestiolae CBS 10118]